jgi:putative peptidoglycan binding protein
VAGVDGPCTFQAVNNALSILKGTNLFVTVEDMAAAMGRAVSELTTTDEGFYELGAWVDDLVPLIRESAKVKEVTGLNSIRQVVDLAERESGVVIFAVRTTVRTAVGTTRELLHSVIAVRNAAGAVRFADYGGRLVGSLDQLIANLGYGTPISTELLQSGSSATIVEGMKLTGEYAAKLARGAFLVIEGITAIETRERGARLAVPVAIVATSAPANAEQTPTDVIKGSFEAFKTRKAGRRVVRMPDVAIKAGRKAAPRPDWLTGVQFRLNALGFGAGRVDGIMGPRTRQALRAFQKAYPPLLADGIPGPLTQAKLVEVCGY